jgi:hypothetical protein
VAITALVLDQAFTGAPHDMSQVRWYEQMHLNTGKEYFPLLWAEYEQTVSVSIAWFKALVLQLKAYFYTYNYGDQYVQASYLSLLATFRFLHSQQGRTQIRRWNTVIRSTLLLRCEGDERKVTGMTAGKIKKDSENNT